MKKLIYELIPSLPLPCNGKGICGKCKVIVTGELSEISPDEKRLLSAKELSTNVRLACKTYALGDVTISRITNAKSAIVTTGIIPDFKINPLGKSKGVAVDIGTTTVCAVLYNLENAELINSTSMNNPQTKFGADVISRIEVSLDGRSPILASTIRKCINELLHNLDNPTIDTLIITGNTTMLYLLCDIDVNCLARSPFKPTHFFGEFIDTKKLELNVPKDTRIYIPRCIAAFVGADITTAILSSQMLTNSPTILVDIGTNGEMALHHNSKLICCSTAAGPAFEGANLSCGMNAEGGAIDKVYIVDNQINFTTIDNLPAVGICGSGIIDAVAVLLKLEIIDGTGAFTTDENFFTFPNTTITITAKDIRTIQLSKAAICAGILSLINAANLPIDDIKTLYIAGGFGKFISIENAAYIGLIPQKLTEKSVAIGNAALIGAILTLLDKDNVDQLDQIAKSTENLELSTSPFFMEKYIDCMMYGE